MGLLIKGDKIYIVGADGRIEERCFVEDGQDGQPCETSLYEPTSPPVENQSKQQNLRQSGDNRFKTQNFSQQLFDQVIQFNRECGTQPACDFHKYNFQDAPLFAGVQTTFNASSLPTKAVIGNPKNIHITEDGARKRPIILSFLESESILKKDMSYADLRKQLLADNWQPIVDPECKQNVGGTALICEQITELESCSGDGYCKMNFQHKTNRTKLTVITYGDYQDWKVLGQKSKLRVINWSFETSFRE